MKNQSYPNIEHIVVDGGSTDDTLDIVRKYGDSIILISEPDDGQSDAVNKGWRRANGGILGWLNSDDTYMPWAVQTAINFLSENPDIGMVYGGCNIIDERGKVIGQHHVEEFDVGKVLCGGRCVIAQPATFLHKEVLDEVGYLDTNLHMAMDLDLWIRIALKFKVQYVNQVLANFRLCPGTKSVSSPDTFWPDRLAIIDKTFSNLEPPEEIRALRNQAYSNAHFMIGTQAMFHSGRIALINGDWEEAKRSFMEALRNGRAPMKLGALLGLICSYCRVDLEWIAAIMNKPRRK